MIPDDLFGAGWPEIGKEPPRAPGCVDPVAVVISGKDASSSFQAATLAV
jgi:hypothetical protein